MNIVKISQNMTIETIIAKCAELYDKDEPILLDVTSLFNGITIKHKIVQEKPLESEKLCQVFESLWKIYPRKINKVEAHKIFFRKIRGLTEEEAIEKSREIYRKLTAQNTIWNQEERPKQFLPHFATWLNSNFENKGR